MFSEVVPLGEDVAIRVGGVSKAYAVFEQPADRLRQMIAAGTQRLTGIKARRYHSEFWALRDVSLEVRRGECVALIGRNGSGKSTLLQIITGTMTPTTGTAEINGRVAALLELGSGFNPEFSGLENVYLNASLLGMQRDEVDARLDDILAFADIGEFISHPVRTYSSGMVVRLAFAVQAQIDPDILIVDEALAVGDARFQAKCFARLKALREQGTSILLVTHSTEQVVTHCDRAVLLERGRVLADGAPRPVVNKYLDLLYGREVQVTDQTLAGPSETPELPAQLLEIDPDFVHRPEPLFQSRPMYNRYEHRWGDRRAEIVDFLVVGAGAAYPQRISAGSTLVIYVRCRFAVRLMRPIFGITLKTKEGLTIYGTNTEMVQMEVAFNANTSVLRCELPINCAAGDYFLSLGIASRDEGGEAVPHDRRYDSIHFCVDAERPFLGVTDLQAKLEVL